MIAITLDTCKLEILTQGFNVRKARNPWENADWTNDANSRTGAETVKKSIFCYRRKIDYGVGRHENRIRVRHADGSVPNPILSPDGSRVAVDVADLNSSSVSIWLEELEGNSSTRFTFNS